MDIEDRLESLESGLRTLTAKDDIWRLIARYARAVDEEIDAELAAIFTDDTVFQTIPWTDEPLIGRDNAVKAFKSYLRRFNNRKRFITNEQIDITGADSATAWSNWLVMHANDGESYVGWGSYDWDFARIKGAWLISKMVITVDCMTTLENGWGDAENLIAGYPGRREG